MHNRLIGLLLVSLLTAGAAADVTAGRYELVAGAPQFGTHFERAFDVAGGAREIAVSLTRLASVAGKIVDAQGTPIASARIGMYWEFLDNYPRRLSDRASAHFGRNTLARSDDDGLFELWLPDNRGAVAIIEADGFAPIAVDRIVPGTSALQTVVLEAGIVLRRASDPPVFFDRVRLPKSATTVLSLELPVRDDSAPAERRVQLAGPSTARIQSVRRWRSGEVTPIAVEEAPGSSGVMLTWSAVDCREGDRYLVTSADAVAAFAINDCSAWPQTVRSRERADIHFTVVVPRGQTPPPAALLEASGCDSEETIALPVEIREQSVSTPYVAGCSSAILSAPGFSSAFLGQISLKRRERRELPPQSLDVGGSLLLRVIDPDGVPVPEVRVWAASADDVARVRTMEALLAARAIARTVTDDKGRAQFSLPPDGEHRLLLQSRQTALPQLSAPFTLRPRDQRLEQIVLERPAVVAVAIESGETGIGASAAILTPASGSVWPATLEIRAKVGTDKRAVFDAVPAGSWRAGALAQAQGGTAVPVGNVPVEVVGGAQVDVTVPLADMLTRGLVKRGSEAVNGMLTLSPTDRRGAHQVVLVEDGRFSLLLEREAEFRASLQTFDGNRIPAVAPVTFRPKDDETVIVLGTGRIGGRVEDERGGGAPDARVVAVRPGDRRTEAQVQAGSAGVFELDALPAGQWQVHAFAPGRRSEPQLVELRDDEVMRGIVLSLRPLTTIKGRINTAAGGPAARAMVIAQDYRHPDREALITMTDQRGEFTFQVPQAEPVTANLVVVTADKAISGRRATMQDGMTVVLPGGYAAVTIRGRKTSLDAAALRYHVLVSDDGTWLQPLQTGRVENGALFIPALGPGKWRYVDATTPATRNIIRSGAGNLVQPLTSFVAEPLRTLEVMVDLDTVE